MRPGWFAASEGEIKAVSKLGQISDRGILVGGSWQQLIPPLASYFENWTMGDSGVGCWSVMGPCLRPFHGIFVRRCYQIEDGSGFSSID